MGSELVTAGRAPVAATALEQVLIQGDLSKLSSEQRVQYYNAVCESLGLNPLTRPFEYMSFQGKLILYAKRDCTEQLRKLQKVSLRIVSREKIGDVYVVTAQAKTPDGREDESTGAVALGKLSGDALANLYMKAETKAKRRVTLSICGLGLPDESELDPSAKAAFHEPSVASATDVQTGEAAVTQGSPRESLPRTGPAVSVQFYGPTDASKNDPGEYIIPFGKDKGKKIKDLGASVIRSRVNYFYDIRAQGGPLKGSIPQFLDYAERYLKAVEPPLEAEPLAAEFATAEDERMPFEREG